MVIKVDWINRKKNVIQMKIWKSKEIVGGGQTVVHIFERTSFKLKKADKS